MMTAHFVVVGWLGWSVVGDPVEQWREGWLGAFSFISVFYFILF